jgi:hypothetical protein
MSSKHPYALYIKQSAVLALLCLFSIQVTVSCKKDQKEPNPDTGSGLQGRAQSFRNNEYLELDISTLISSDYPNKFSMGLYHYNSNGFVRGSFSLRHIPLEKGSFLPQNREFSLDPSIDSLFTVFYGSHKSDGDVAGDKFVLVDTSTNFFSIDSLNLTTKEAFGRFSLLMRKDTSQFGELDFSLPQVLNFTNGSYAVTINR